MLQQLFPVSWCSKRGCESAGECVRVHVEMETGRDGSYRWHHSVSWCASTRVMTCPGARSPTHVNNVYVCVCVHSPTHPQAHTENIDTELPLENVLGHTHQPLASHLCNRGVSWPSTQASVCKTVGRLHLARPYI